MSHWLFKLAFLTLDDPINVQRLMKLRNPAVGDLKAATLIDAKLIQELDQSDFIDQLYSAYGVKIAALRFSFDLNVRDMRVNSLLLVFADRKR